MPSRDADASGSERSEYGVFGCPMPNCSDTIVGHVDEFVDHVDSHALSNVSVDSETGKSAIQRAKEYRSEVLDMEENHA